MNKKIWFDLDNFDRDVFKEKMKDVKILVGETYCVDIYNSQVGIHRKGLKRISRIPFTLLDTKNRDKLIELLFYRIDWNIPYDGTLFEGRFYIRIHKYIW